MVFFTLREGGGVLVLKYCNKKINIFRTGEMAGSGGRFYLVWAYIG
jgi:hypothetical protein